MGRFYVFVCVCVRKGSLHERNIFMTTTMTWHFFVSSFGGFGMSTSSNQELGYFLRKIGKMKLSNLESGREGAPGRARDSMNAPAGLSYLGT